jgi:hypothetical protein
MVESMLRARRALAHVVDLLVHQVASPDPNTFFLQSGLDPIDPWTGWDRYTRLQELAAQGWKVVNKQEQSSKGRCRVLMRSDRVEGLLLVAVTQDELTPSRLALDCEWFPDESVFFPWQKVPSLNSIDGSLAEAGSRFMEIREAEQVLGMTGVLQRGRELPLLTASIGCESLNPETRIAPSSRFRAGSITKVVTALAALELDEQGVLSIEQPVAPLLPDTDLRMDPSGPEITIRHLLVHTGGLPRNGSLEQPIYQSSPSGQSRRYSNLGYCLLARAIESVTGVDFASWVRTRIFTVLGMHDSAIETVNAELTGYDRGFGYVWPAKKLELDSGARGLTTTCLDLIQLGLRILAVPRMFEAQAIGQDLDAHYGLGILRGSVGNRMIAFHDGGVANSWQSYLAVEPISRTVIAVMANSHPVSTESLAESILTLAIQ